MVIQISPVRTVSLDLFRLVSVGPCVNIKSRNELNLVGNFFWINEIYFGRCAVANRV